MMGEVSLLVFDCQILRQTEMVDNMGMILLEPLKSGGFDAERASVWWWWYDVCVYLSCVVLHASSYTPMNIR